METAMGPSERRTAKTDLDEMAPLIYGELRRLARHYLSGRQNQTLQPTALVHEAYLRLTQQHSVDFQNRGQLIGIAAGMMRRILINHARDRKALKRDGLPVSLDVHFELAAADNRIVDVLDLDRALDSLGKLDPLQEKIVELRFFGGLSIEETAAALEIGSATVKRNWSTARLFLVRRMSQS
ncbi:MAG TPA: ECF-type sigma factor [Candidatus Sulfopaludibacter sp.]|jgi:RNA polymerase sigma factor (TIGR02999 family)|nr:ECF-type sigma factor [Candidatus Sulfopaludibacter sp.]